MAEERVGAQQGDSETRSSEICGSHAAQRRSGDNKEDLTAEEAMNLLKSWNPHGPVQDSMISSSETELGTPHSALPDNPFAQCYGQFQVAQNSAHPSHARHPAAPNHLSNVAVFQSEAECTLQKAMKERNEDDKLLRRRSSGYVVRQPRSPEGLSVSRQSSSRCESRCASSEEEFTHLESTTESAASNASTQVECVPAGTAELLQGLSNAAAVPGLHRSRSGPSGFIRAASSERPSGFSRPASSESVQDPRSASRAQDSPRIEKESPTNLLKRKMSRNRYANSIEQPASQSPTERLKSVEEQMCASMKNLNNNQRRSGRNNYYLGPKAASMDCLCSRPEIGARVYTGAGEQKASLELKNQMTAVAAEASYAANQKRAEFVWELLSMPNRRRDSSDGSCRRSSCQSIRSRSGSQEQIEVPTSPCDSDSRTVVFMSLTNGSKFDWILMMLLAVVFVMTAAGIMMTPISRKCSA